VYSASLAGNASTPAVQLPNTKTNAGYVNPTSWSPDGARLAGPISADSGRSAGVGIYDLRAHAATVLIADETYGVRWLADSRRVMYFTKQGTELVVVDVASRQRTVINVRLPWPSTRDVFAISPDNRAIYYGAVHAEADIWIAERK
jgi:hypothetical protein